MKLKKLLKETNLWTNRKFGDPLPTVDDYKKAYNEKNNLVSEARKLDQKNLDKIHKFTQNNNHTEARIHLATLMGSDKLYRFYNAMEVLNDIFNGDGPEQTKLKQKMEKELYKAIKKAYLNSAEVIGLL